MKSILKNLANLITLMRFVLTAIFSFLLIFQLEGYEGKTLVKPIIVIFLLICISDFIDGKIARRMKLVSSMGAILDVTADFTFILSAFVVFNFFKIVPIWFTGLIVVKFIEFQVTSFILKSRYKSISSTFVFDFFGRVSAFMFYIIPGLVCFVNGYFNNASELIISLVVWITTIITLISLANRGLNCYKAVRPEVRLQNGV